MQSARVIRPAAAGGNPVVAALGIQDGTVLTATPFGQSGSAFLEVACGRNHGPTDAVCEDAFLIALQMTPSADFDLFADGRFIRPERFEAGAVALFDLRANFRSDIRDPFHAVDFYLPRRLLDVITDDAGLPSIDELRYRPGIAVHDSVSSALLQSMRPALAAEPHEVSALFVDHVATAMAVHVAHQYGGIRLLRPTARGGLAAWQERRASEMLSAHMHGRISLRELALACNLSVRQFTRAFRQSTGLAPHEWLMRRRIEKAKGLLTQGTLSLAEIAADCGYADQSHMARAFRRSVGTSPTSWRRAYHGGKP